MVTFKVLLYLFAFFNFSSWAKIHNMRRCVDCVSLTSCESALTFVRKIRDGILAYEKRDILLNSLCGYDANQIPKVCCSDFAEVNTETGTEKPASADSIETHPNFGLLPSSCGDIYGSRLLIELTVWLHELPWMALIAYNTNGGTEFGCAGSIINSRYILTAAHCVIHNGAFKNIAGVRIGELDYSTDVDCQGHGANMKCETRIQDMHVEEIIPHEEFNEQHPVTADIALLRLSAPIVMHDNAAPICLPVHEELRAVNLTDRSATVAGWGVTENRPDSSRLMKEQIPIKSGDICNSYYNMHENQTHFEKAFCAGTMNKDSCIGDSGGPLMVEADYNGSIRFVQYGIASLGLRPCGSQSPAIYTDVSKYMDWILDHIKE